MEQFVVASAHFTSQPSPAEPPVLISAWITLLVPVVDAKRPAPAAAAAAAAAESWLHIRAFETTSKVLAELSLPLSQISDRAASAALAHVPRTASLVAPVLEDLSVVGSWSHESQRLLFHLTIQLSGRQSILVSNLVREQPAARAASSSSSSSSSSRTSMDTGLLHEGARAPTLLERGISVLDWSVADSEQLYAQFAWVSGGNGQRAAASVDTCLVHDALLQTTVVRRKPSGPVYGGLTRCVLEPHVKGSAEVRVHWQALAADQPDPADDLHNLVHSPDAQRQVSTPSAWAYRDQVLVRTATSDWRALEQARALLTKGRVRRSSRTPMHAAEPIATLQEAAAPDADLIWLIERAAPQSTRVCVSFIALTLSLSLSLSLSA